MRVVGKLRCVGDLEHSNYPYKHTRNTLKWLNKTPGPAFLDTLDSNTGETGVCVCVCVCACIQVQGQSTFTWPHYERQPCVYIILELLASKNNH